MHRKYKNYEGHWGKMPQTVGELLNYYLGPVNMVKEKVRILYDGLVCPITSIAIKQKGEQYSKEKHLDYQVNSWYVDFNTKELLIFVKVDDSLLPPELVEHSNNKQWNKYEDDFDVFEFIDEEGLDLFDFIEEEE